MTPAQSRETTPDPASTARESLSQLLARILDQLSISAWLPAAALVFIALLYGNLNANANDPRKALVAISSMTFQGLILLSGAVVLLTMATQAFEFEAIRFLEGYWGAGPIGTLFSKHACAFQIRRRKRLRQMKRDLEIKAFGDARGQMLGVNKIPKHLVDILEYEVLGTDRPDHQPEEFENAGRLGWNQFAKPADVRYLDVIIEQLQEYPDEDYRILPTRLGNTLRAREEMLDDAANGSLEGTILRVYDWLPASVQSEHDRYRGRLDLYCSMVVVLFVGAAAAPALLLNGNWLPPALVAGLALILALLCYRAAIASARGYGVVLETVQELIEQGLVGHTLQDTGA